MPLSQHGSRKAIEHWRGFRSSPLGQNPLTANLGGRAQKGEERCQKEMIVRAVKATEDNLRVCLSFAAMWRELIWAVSGTGCALRRRMERSRNRQLQSNDAGIAAPGGVAESTSGRVGGDGEHGSLLDCSPRGVRSARFASLSGGYATTGAGTGAGQENRSQRLRVDAAAAQLRTAAGFVPAGGSGMHAANPGTG